MKATKIVFPTCTVEWEPEHRRVVTRFPDGSEAYGRPHDTDAYRAHAADKSTGDVDLYCWQHDIAHVIVALMQRKPSIVLWDLAHGRPTDQRKHDREEAEAQLLQRKLFLRNG